ncbi:hypothetical protein ABH944_007489 [Caballeronia udeis]|uniref:Uncharacterized protein n=1 Tax=Caballeronia udeis TaxID=1232866 RepID=A0ABW8MXW7_9BURK
MKMKVSRWPLVIYIGSRSSQKAHESTTLGEHVEGMTDKENVDNGYVKSVGLMTIEVK